MGDDVSTATQAARTVRTIGLPRGAGPIGMGGGWVSVLVVMTVAGDTAKFESFMAENPDRVLELTKQAKAAGCLAHRFAVGDGQVVVVDEWENADQFQAFISSPDLQAVMGEMGAQGEPQVTVANPKGFPGEF